MISCSYLDIIEFVGPVKLAQNTKKVCKKQVLFISTYELNFKKYIEGLFSRLGFKKFLFIILVIFKVLHLIVLSGAEKCLRTKMLST